MSNDFLTQEQFLDLCTNNVLNRTNVSITPWEYIECFRGPQAQDLKVAVAITIINCIIFVTGIIGNAAVCFVIFKHKSLNTPTDYYLVNLAVSDITLLLFGLPYDVMLYWHQYPWIFGQYFCQARALFSEMASYVSVLTVVVFSTERYVAICHPLIKVAVSSLQRCLRIILILWVVSFFCALPFAIHSGVDYITHPEEPQNIIMESAFCAMTAQPENIPLTEVSSIVFFVIPMAVILYQYVKMGIVIRRSAKSQSSLGRGISGSVHGRNKRHQEQRNNVVKMLSFIALGFFICWCPFHIQRLLSVYMNNSNDFDELNYWMYTVAGVLYYISSTVNPIVYNVMSNRMRNAFRQVICGVEVRGMKRLSRRSTIPTYTSDRLSNVFVDEEEALNFGKTPSLQPILEKA
nr:neuropeptides capa receptor-like [Leptinotarsa decemlineata]